MASIGIRSRSDGRAAESRPRVRAPLRGVGAAAGSIEAARSLDRILHHRLRLGLVSALAGAGTLSFVELRSLLDTSDGNLSVHARRLEEAGYVSCAKSFAERRPRSDYRLTASGRRALQRYLDHMAALIAATRQTLDR